MPRRAARGLELLDGGGQQLRGDEVVPVRRRYLEELQQDQITLLNILGARPLGDTAVLEEVKRAELASSWLLQEPV
jgi:hypothetical protein